MRTLAVKEPSHTQRRQAEVNRAVAQPSHRSLSSGVLQRKSSCACGGGCPRCQTKLKISEPGDKYEQEADRVAEVPDIVHDVLRSPGQPLDSATRALMEPRFGHDFSQVRVHTGGDADRSTREVNAHAYTVGHNVVFGADQFSPGTHEGRRLLAHELTHVIQNRGQQVQQKPENKQTNFFSIIPTITTAQHKALQRAVRISANDTQLQITSEPEASLVVQSLFGHWRARLTTPQRIAFEASAQASCDPGDNSAGYEIGLVQVQTREVNNAYYRGATSADGSVWIRRDIPSVRPIGSCLDSAYNMFWHSPKPITCNSKSSLTHWDAPQDMYPTIHRNPRTKRRNYLRTIHAAFDFTTALMLKLPNNTLQTLRWLRWDVDWNYHFTTPSSGESRIDKGSISRHGSVQFFDAVPPPPEIPIVYDIPVKNCNTISMEASDNSASIQPSNQWESE